MGWVVRRWSMSISAWIWKLQLATQKLYGNHLQITKDEIPGWHVHRVDAVAESGKPRHIWRRHRERNRVVSVVQPTLAEHCGTICIHHHGVTTIRSIGQESSGQVIRKNGGRRSWGSLLDDRKTLVAHGRQWYRLLRHQPWWTLVRLDGGLRYRTVASCLRLMVGSGREMPIDVTMFPLARWSGRHVGSSASRLGCCLVTEAALNRLGKVDGHWFHFTFYGRTSTGLAVHFTTAMTFSRDATHNYSCRCHLWRIVKGKGFLYSLPSTGPGADPGVQAVNT